MNRRDALKYTALSLGYALTATTASAVLSGCQADTSSDWAPSTLTKDQLEAVAAMAETILPTTDSSPGACDVYVHRFIDELLTNWASDETREEWLSGLEALREDLKGSGNKSFDKRSAEDQHEVLSEMNTRALTADEPSPSEAFYKEFKGMVVSGYFSSEEVGKNVLAYDPIPGGYQSCIPYEEVGKLWSL